AVGPAKPDLQRIFAAAPDRRAGVRRPGHVVLLREHAESGVTADVGRDPASRDFAREVRLGVGSKALDREILQGRPAVGLVPLLTGFCERRLETAGPEQA